MQDTFFDKIYPYYNSVFQKCKGFLCAASGCRGEEKTAALLSGGLL